jgi:tetratricopeptide (TPR) repeat protein
MIRRQSRFVRTFGVASFAATLLLVAGSAGAEVVLSAREHFEQGVEASRRGDLVLALEHFEKAQALSPNLTVLYNLGQTYSALDRPVDALRALERYREMDGPGGDPTRRREVELLVKKNEARVGTLAVELDPTDAVLQVDGVATEVPADHELRIASGRRFLTATRPGYHPAVLVVEIRPSEASRVRLALERSELATDAFIEAICPTPDVTVVINDVTVGRSPRTPIVPAVSGEHRVRFERAGYRRDDTTLVVNPKSIARVRCSLVTDPNLAPNARTELRVVGAGPEARVSVNGGPYRQEKLPLGAHLVEVSAPGFLTWRRVVTLRPGPRNDLAVSLEPTAETRRAQSARTRTIVAYSVGGAGVALGALAAVVYVTNQSRYDDWNSDWKELSGEISSGESSPDHAERVADLQERAATIQRADDVALGAALLGGVAVAVSLGLLLSGSSDVSELEKRASRPLTISF